VLSKGRAKNAATGSHPYFINEKRCCLGTGNWISSKKRGMDPPKNLLLAGKSDGIFIWTDAKD
jgi:hypothetical protein